jgi:hypothetical protein
VTTKLADVDDPAGVPEIAPVPELNDKPLGNDGEIDHEVIPPPTFVGVKTLIARPASDEREELE